jgi:hypothetical protein
MRQPARSTKLSAEVVALCYILKKTRQDTYCRTLLQFDEDSTRYLQLHSVTIWRGLDRIPTVELCCNLMRTRQEIWSITLLQFDEDSTRYPQLHSVTIWRGLDRIPTAELCCNLMRTRQGTCSCTLLQFEDDSTIYLLSKLRLNSVTGLPSQQT